ncbi:uncharacterized protein METZ01_LOCUS90554, partial [marine metagenome]
GTFSWDSRTLLDGQQKTRHQGSHGLRCRWVNHRLSRAGHASCRAHPWECPYRPSNNNQTRL